MEESKFEIFVKSRKFKIIKIFWGLINNYCLKINELLKIYLRIVYWNIDLCNICFKFVMKVGNLNLIRV